MKYFDYTYQNYDKDIKQLVGLITKSEKKYDLVVGIQRGGLIPAVHISNALNIPFAVLQWSSKGVRDSSNQYLITSKNKNVLLVDDILDGGHTLRDILLTYWEMDTATLIYNRTNKFNLVPTYTAWIIDRETFPQWFNFWWEKVV